MIDFSDWIRKLGYESLMYYGTFDQVCSHISNFEKLKISPVRVSKRCPYIPLFSDMLNDAVDDNLLSFARNCSITIRLGREGAVWDNTPKTQETA